MQLCLRALRRVDADPAASAELRAQILVTLACYRSELGAAQVALALLEEALRTDPASEAAVLTARGMVLLRSGDGAAMAALDRAIQALSGVTARTARPGAGPSDLAAALLNRGVLHMVAGRLRLAQQDTEAAEQAAQQIGRTGVVVMARHNLGYITFLRGDLPGALHAMAEAAAVAPDTTHGVQSLDRARVLISAGLLTEAAEFTDDALRAFRRNRAMPDLAEASLVRSEVDLLSREARNARMSARRAAAIYANRGNTTAMLTARLLEMRADAQSRSRVSRKRPRTVGRQATADAAEAAALADQLSAVRSPGSGRDRDLVRGGGATRCR